MTAIPGTGVVVDDFNQIYADLGITLSYEVVTKTTDPTTGTETTTYAAAANVTVIFFLEQNRFVWDKEGLLEVGDAYIIAPLTMGIKRYDKFTINGEKYYIDNTTRRDVAGVGMSDYGTCFKVQ